MKKKKKKNTMGKFSLSLPNDKILNWSKMKAFAEDKIKVLEIMISVFDYVETIVGIGENPGN